MKKVISIILAVVIGAGALLAVGWALVRGAKAQGNKPTVVRLGKPVRGELTELVTAPGRLKPKVKVDLSARLSARVAELPVRQGQQVKKGDLLVRLDAEDLRAGMISAEARREAQAAQIEVQKSQMAQAQANVARLSAALEQGRRDWERQQGLLTSRDVSQASVDQMATRVEELAAEYEAAQHGLRAAKLGLTVLESNLKAADAEIARARDELSYTQIVSPIDGVVTRINAEVGELVITGTMNNPGTVILQVADLAQMLLVAEVAESNIGAVQVGQKATVRIPAYPGRTFQGVVSAISLSPVTTFGGGEAAKSFETEILLDTGGERLYSGLTADVDIETKRHAGVLKVPSQAVLARPVDGLPLAIREQNRHVDPNKTYATVVYLVRDGRAVATPLKIGPGDATHTVVEAGLTEQDEVIVGPYKVLESIQHDAKVKDERQVEAEKAARSKVGQGKEGGAGPEANRVSGRPAGPGN